MAHCKSNHEQYTEKREESYAGLIMPVNKETPLGMRNCENVD